MTFKVGDMVRLVGPGWEESKFDSFTPHEVFNLDADGRAILEGGWYGDDTPGSDWEVKVISGNSEKAIRNRAKSFEESVLAFAQSDQVVSEEQIEQIQTLGEKLGISSFEQNVHRITSQIADLLIEKNAAYGDSALNPIRVFSKSDRIEQLNVRIDDKISRIQRGSEYGDEDTEMDLIGYLVLRKIARESE